MRLRCTFAAAFAIGTAPASGQAQMTLTPLTRTDEAQYQGAGCIIHQNGHDVFITDFRQGIIRVNGHPIILISLAGNGVFDPENGEMGARERGDSALVQVTRRPGRVTTDPESETRTIPVRVYAYGLDHNGVGHEATFDAFIVCGA